MVEKIVYAPGASEDGVVMTTEEQMREEFEKALGINACCREGCGYKSARDHYEWNGYQLALSTRPRMSEEELALFGRFKTMLEKEEQVYEASFGCGDDANEAEVNIDFASLFGFTVDEFQSVLALIAKLPHIVREA